MTDRQSDGRARMREVLGGPYMDAREKTASAFNAPVRQLSEESAYSFVWGRPGLDRRTRSLINLGMLTALNRRHELRVHVRGAVNNGVTRDEILETLLQAAIYCGVPAGMEAFRAAEEVLGELAETSPDGRA